MRGLAVAGACLAAGGLAVTALAGCGSAKPPPFDPGTQSASAAATAQASGPGDVVMPSFGTNAHVVVSGWRPAKASWAAALVADEDYQLAYLYAEYTGGRSQDWTVYVSSALDSEISTALSATDVTTESFQGTIRFFDLSVAADSPVKDDLRVSGCVDDAQALDTSLKTGAVLPGQSASDSSYYRYTDELAPAGDGQWQVVAEFQPVYYPQAKECKP